MSEGFVIINALSHFLRSFLPPNQEDERRASEGEKKEERQIKKACRNTATLANANTVIISTKNASHIITNLRRQIAEVAAQRTKATSSKKRKLFVSQPARLSSSYRRPSLHILAFSATDTHTHAQNTPCSLSMSKNNNGQRQTKKCPRKKSK